MKSGPWIVVIPCYRVKQHILGLLKSIPNYIDHILVVDDACPDQTGLFVQKERPHPKVEVLFHRQNQGVGGAVVTGYKRALELGAQIVVKMDGDGQMDPALLPRFLSPLSSGQADYVKGNRFYRLESLKSMPPIRIFGNSILSFVTKLASGYWDIMDPTNGYTAIHSAALSLLPLDKLDRRYFFESDLLFRLYTVRAVVKDTPINSKYADEKSNLQIRRIALEFPLKYFKCLLKRIVYTYYLRDFNAASLELLLGLLLVSFGLTYGLREWWIASFVNHVPAASGVIMMAALPLILGVQLLLSSLSIDIANVPREPLQKQLLKRDEGFYEVS